MKPALKALAWSVGGLAGLALLIWGISLLYWHFAITYSLKQWKQAPRGQPLAGIRWSPERAYLQSSAGCRALPYAVAALDANDDDPVFQEVLMEYLISALGGPGPHSDEAFRILGERASRWAFIADGLDLERRDRIADFKTWWQTNGRRYHAWWRTWSKWCPEGGDSLH